ncbi:MAG TPA: cupin domain-containing protein [Burkholderiales bacterium]|nr:cupin domain-containing protein [Burkholderiales bacterium]
MNKQLLGGLSAAAFLRRHWQKKPLLVRNAIPHFDGIQDFGALVEFASRQDCESRLVVRHGTRWTVEHGPFHRKRFSRLPARNWTLLVQGLESMLPAARKLLSNFDFIPYSRLDDVMVSYAAPGGGVGPHFDSYDVFLLQGPGQRRWRVSGQRDMALVEGAPLKLLKRFLPEGECLVSAGDMLYLPPACAHEGIAVDCCFTYSIGFRAPSHQELTSQFLVHLEDKAQATGRYSDPDLLPQAHPARLGSSMVAKVERLLANTRWQQRDVAEFLGIYLTEPKARVVFKPPHQRLSEAAFSMAAKKRGVELALPSSMLYSRATHFMNGESYTTVKAVPVLRRLADTRRLAPLQVPIDGAAMDLLYRWYHAGYIVLSQPGRDD